jgi:hypothetical protein
MKKNKLKCEESLCTSRSLARLHKATHRSDLNLIREFTFYVIAC